MVKVNETFNDLLIKVSKVADSMGLFLDREAPNLDGMQHVGWWCPTCEARLMSCNRSGHRAGLGFDWRKSECSTPGEELLPMYVSKEK